MMDVIINNINDNWKSSKRVFEKQLELNLKQLENKISYPEHWNIFLKVINTLKPKNILDIGCGCGAYYKLLKDNNYDGLYIGYDYSNDAINIAMKQWQNNNIFFVKDLFELNEDDVKGYDLIHLGALLDVLVNADEALEHILKICNKNVNNILIGRMKLTNNNNNDSYYTKYIAYDEIETVSFFHNINKFNYLCEKYNYIIKQNNDNFLLTIKYDTKN